MQKITTREGAFYDPETVSVLTTVLDDAWQSLLPAQRARMTKANLATRILKAAANGERDPARLRALALIRLVA
jgi:hypothetical protein